MMSLLHIFLALLIMASMSKAELINVDNPLLVQQLVLCLKINVERHALRDAQLHLTKNLACFIATIVVNGVSVFHQEPLGIKSVVHATIIGRQREEDQNVHEIKLVMKKMICIGSILYLFSLFDLLEMGFLICCKIKNYYFLILFSVW
ncbi:uncharacterized protein LOC132604935 [Lycium barbarum]|uniref:uncharacterized protein LOC132604935 n=1 Tax=Lycium barbarum TaxID=112863 RepID=UPI00293E4A00|nr:uncharacterized protein LOC132604935 [Lycium barbarum]